IYILTLFNIILFMTYCYQCIFILQHKIINIPYPIQIPILLFSSISPLIIYVKRRSINFFGDLESNFEGSCRSRGVGAAIVAYVGAVFLFITWVGTIKEGFL
ncbi:MAG: hypothetical protein CSA32_00675, partial [Desulfobulbus propionicus]